MAARAVSAPPPRVADELVSELPTGSEWVRGRAKFSLAHSVLSRRPTPAVSISSHSAGASSAMRRMVVVTEDHPASLDEELRVQARGQEPPHVRRAQRFDELGELG